MTLEAIIALIDSKKVVYSPNSAHWPAPEGYEEGDEVEESESEWNEALNFIIEEFKEDFSFAPVGVKNEKN